MNENAKLIAVAVLAVTAVLMLCTLLILDRLPISTAYAGHAPDRQGDYLMVSGGTIAGDECVYVVDIGSQRMVAYTADPPNNRVLLKAGLDMTK